MKIQIQEIPSEGLDLELNEKDFSNRFNHLNSLQVSVRLFPVGGGFDVSGKLLAKVPMDCSFCAQQLPIPVEETFHEIMLFSPKRQPVYSKDGEEVIDASTLEEFYIEGNEIDLYPLIKDMIEVSLPIQPKCIEKGAPQNYPKCQADWDYESYFKENSEKPLVNPFESLKNLKNLKKK